MGFNFNSLDELIVCRNILAHDDIFTKGHGQRNSSAANLIERAETLGLGGNLYRSYLIYLLAHEPNLISTSIEMHGGKISEDLRKLFIHDILSLLPILSSELENFYLVSEPYIPTMPNQDESLKNLMTALDEVYDTKPHTNEATKIADIFIEHYRNFGYGDIAAYRAFRWDATTSSIIGIRHFESIRLDDLIGYVHQKELLTGNTSAFVDGKPANNVLLVGARGTGKSSGVKALVNEYYAKGLRLVQITKPQLKSLPELMETLRRFMSKKFIIFLDDLSFEESDAEYKYLKSAIEGGVESRPQNVLIYATSNRRHLIRETWRDRADGQDEIYRDDSVNENISLSDRFGLIIQYYAPTQTEYLEIIRSMLKRRGIKLDDETLRIEGLRWEMSHSGRNGRTAQQFVNHYLGQR
ncbi:MAG: ATP-binding protein [Selenomonadaceae bacterium]|nr:ATP-binding protein [Selenomonadaceae bacterium]